MSHENAELAWQAAWAWNDGGADALIGYLDADVEWHPPSESMESGIYRGHDGVRDYLGRLAEVFGETRTEPLEVIDVDGDRVIAVVRSIARSEHVNTEIAADWAWLITVGSNRKATRVDAFTDKLKALEAAGLAVSAMTQEETVRRAVDAFNARDVEGFAALTTPDFEWLPSMSPIEGETFVGPEGIHKYFEGLAKAWESFHVFPVELRSHALGLLVLGRIEGRGLGSGAAVDSPLGMAFDLRDGMISRIRGYLDHGEALRAVGLE
jgi:ketosteroid isomerase-like protein